MANEWGGLGWVGKRMEMEMEMECKMPGGVRFAFFLCFPPRQWN